MIAFLFTVCLEVGMIAFLFTVALICLPRGGNDCFFAYVTISFFLEVGMSTLLSPKEMLGRFGQEKQTGILWLCQ